METSITEILRRARRAIVDPATVDGLINDIADAIAEATPAILAANELDLKAMPADDPRADRLRLTPARLQGIAADLRTVASLPSPVGVVMESWERPGGMQISKVSVPFGVIGVIYEARPNVTFDVTSLCLKAGSSVVLKGGHDASHSNHAIVEMIHRVLEARGVDTACVTLLPDGHDATLEMLQARDLIDLVIPRGSRRLIDFVRENALVPVIETGAGVCHTYLHTSGRTDYAEAIVLNAKTRRVSVCNALDTLVVDAARLGDLPAVCGPLADKQVVIHADEAAYKALEGHYPLLEHATADDFGREWLGYSMSVATVDNVAEAIDFVNEHGSRHSECIIAEDAGAVALFMDRVDASCVYNNVSTAFTDGGQFGFGAEIGISTQKLHARGPMALREITTYKYLITGPGLTRATS